MVDTCHTHAQHQRIRLSWNNIMGNDEKDIIIYLDFDTFRFFGRDYDTVISELQFAAVSHHYINIKWEYEH